ncbi:hypothetical protein ACTVH1_14475 [Gluconobacter cerinus]
MLTLLGALYASLQNEATGTQARKAMRSLIPRLKLIPENGELAIFLEDDLARILTASGGRTKTPGCFQPRVRDAFALQALLVAGACNQRKLLLVSGLVERLAA